VHQKMPTDPEAPAFPGEWHTEELGLPAGIAANPRYPATPHVVKPSTNAAPASKLYTREEAIVHLDAAIAQRLGKPATLKAAYMLPNDVAFAIKQALQQSKAREHSEDQCATHEGSILMAGTTEGAVVESGEASESPGLGEEPPVEVGKGNDIAIETPSRWAGKAPEKKSMAPVMTIRQARRQTLRTI
jgi:hypothetical protein